MIRLGFIYICNHLFLHLFLKMNILNQCTVSKQYDKIKYSSKQMDVPCRGQVHLTKTNSSLTTISAALSRRRSNPPHVFYRQDAGVSLDEGEKAGGTDREKERGQFGWGSVKWSRSPAAWLSYNMKATSTKSSGTLGVCVYSWQTKTVQPKEELNL